MNTGDSQPPHLIVTQPSTPHRTIAPFLVWTADDLSKTKLANTALFYGASDGPWAAARGRCLSVALPRHGTRGCFTDAQQHTRICCSHTFLLTWISHFGSHCSALVSAATEGRVWGSAANFFNPCPSLPPSSLLSGVFFFFGLFQMMTSPEQVSLLFIFSTKWSI